MATLSHLVGGWAAIDEEPVPLHKLPECVADGVASPPDPDSLHHARVPQLSAAKLSVKHLQKYSVTVTTQYSFYTQTFIFP